MMRARGTLSLGVANLLVAALVLWPWLPQRAAKRGPEPASAEADAPALARLPPFAAFAATTARPLFSPSRRPAADRNEGAGPGIASRYRLQGLLIAGTARHVLLAPVAGGRTLELGEGDAVEGWRVKRIERDRIVLASPAGEATIALQPASAPPPAPAKP